MFGKARRRRRKSSEHKWLESEKGRARYRFGWRRPTTGREYYPYWKEFHVSGEAGRDVAVSTRRAPPAGIPRLLHPVPRAVLFLAVSLLQWTTGIDYTDYIGGQQQTWVAPRCDTTIAPDSSRRVKPCSGLPKSVKFGA